MVRKKKNKKQKQNKKNPCLRVGNDIKIDLQCGSMYFRLKCAQSLFYQKYTCTGLFFYILLQSTADELLFYTMYGNVEYCFFFFFKTGVMLLTFDCKWKIVAESTLN